MAKVIKQTLGIVGERPVGEFDITKEYEYLNIVSYQGESYMVRIEEKITGVLPTDESKWQKLVEKPKKGVDYFDEQDKKEIVDKVTEDSESDFNTYYDNKVKGFDENVQSKTDEFSTNVANKTTTFNSNVTRKTTDFNTNYDDKLKLFNDNNTTKTNEFNQNVVDKTNEFDTHVIGKTLDFDINVTNKTDTFNTNASTKTTEYNDNATTKVEEFNSSVDFIRKDIDDNTSRIKRIESDLFDSGEATGVTINVKDSTLAEMQEIKTTDNVNGWNQNITTGKQLYDVNDKLIFSQDVSTDENDWITISYDNTNSEFVHFINFYTNKSNILKPDTSYKLVLETKELSKENSVGSYISLTNTDGNAGQFNSTNNYYLSIIDSNKKYIAVNKTVEDFDNTNIRSMLHSFVAVAPGKSINVKFRISVVQQDTDTDNFVYEKFTGGQSSPNPNFPQDIEVIESGNYEVTTRNENYFNIDGDYTYGQGAIATTVNEAKQVITTSNVYNFRSRGQLIRGLKKFTDYTFSALVVKAEGTNTFSNVVVQILTKDNKNIQSAYGHQTQTIPYRITTSFNTGDNDCVWLSFNGNNSSVDSALKIETIFEKIQFYEGTTEKSFTEHQESNLPIPIPEGQFYTRPIKDWGDKFYTKYIESENKTHLYLEKNVGKKKYTSTDVHKMTFLTYDNIDYARFQKPNDMQGYGMTARKKVLCDKATYSEIWCEFSNVKNIGKIVVDAEGGFFWIGFPKGTTEEEMKEKLSEFDVYYQLAEPKTYDLGVRYIPLTYWTETNVFNNFPLPVEMSIYYYCDPKRTKTQLLEDMRLAQQEILQLQTDVATLKEQVATILSNTVATASISEEVI